MREPWLTHVLAGRKTIESRFSRVSVAPHGMVDPGDLLLFKRAAGPVCATCVVQAVEFHDVRSGIPSDLRERYGQALCADDEFWEEQAAARYATLMHLTRVTPIPALHLRKRDRRGWVVLDDGPHVHDDQLHLSGLDADHPSPRPVVVLDSPMSRKAPGQLVLPGCIT